jgi:predicted amidohydrolase
MASERKDRPIRVGVIQMNSGGDVRHNLARADALLAEAAAQGARVAALPENFACMGTEDERRGCAQDLDGPIVSFLRRSAKRLSITIVGGSFPERAPDGSGKMFNTCVLVDPEGALAAVYRKVHLFDAEVASGAAYQESAYIQPGGELVVAPAGGILCGLSLCYDLRFPELYRHLTLRGARVIFVPSAFTLFTGKDHWFPLLRARAIENQVYIAAPAQYGRHGERLLTYGHAAVVDPWGTVVAQAPDRECVTVSDIVPAYQDEIRRRLPVLSHLRGDLYPVAGR